jgi:asparagine N-glycosylation enzyme membrane subunit Stt3
MLYNFFIATAKTNERGKIMGDQKKINEHELSITKIIILSLAPGVVILLLAIVFSSPIFGINFNILFSLMLAIILGLIPAEMGLLKFFAQKENKRIRDLVLFKNKTPIKRLLLSIIIPFAIMGIAFSFVLPFELNLWKIFDFVPD